MIEGLEALKKPGPRPHRPPRPEATPNSDPKLEIPRAEIPGRKSKQEIPRQAPRTSAEPRATPRRATVPRPRVIVRHEPSSPSPKAPAQRVRLAPQLSVPRPTARRAFSTSTQSCAVMPAAAPAKSVHAETKESAACTRLEVALSLVVKAR